MGAPDCPFCGSGAVESVGQWGGQIITAQWRCEACSSYFEALRSDFDDPKPATITVSSRIAWMDTDAAGIYHYTTTFRLAEAAEAALHTALGFEELTFGKTPRVHVEADFLAPLRFNDRVETTLSVAKVGRTSVTYAIEVARAGELCIRAQIVTCLVDHVGGATMPWPEHIRERLSCAGVVVDV